LAIEIASTLVSPFLIGRIGSWLKVGWCARALDDLLPLAARGKETRQRIMRIPAIVITQSGHRDRRFWAS